MRILVILCLFSGFLFAQEQYIKPNNGFVGVQDDAGDWIIEPVYQKITVIRETGQNFTANLSFVYCCQTVDFDNYFLDYYFDEFDTNFIDLRNNLGKKIHENSFYSMTLLTPALIEDNMLPIEYAFISNDKNYILMPDLSLVETNVQVFLKHMSWYLAKNEYGKELILNSKFKEIAQFDRVTQYTEVIYGTDEIELFDQIESFHQIDNEAFLIVYQNNISLNQEEVAIFDLRQEKIVSPWIEQTAFTLTRFNEESLFPWFSFSYSDASKNLVGFFMDGMSTGTALEYTSIDLVFPFVLCHTSSETIMDLFSWTPDTCKLIAKEKQFFPSSTYGFSENFDFETGEFSIDDMGSLKENFCYSIDQNKKYGFVLMNGKVIENQFDEFYQNPDFSSIIDLRIGDKYGSLEVFTGDLFFPKQDQKLSYSYDPISNQYYVKTDSAFLKTTGESFYNLNFEYEVFKSKRKYGVQMKSDFDPLHNPKLIIPAKYKSLTILDPFSGIVVAKLKKNVGLINLKSEILVPFEYDEIGHSEIQLHETQPTFSVKKREKHGLFELQRGFTIPARFDAIYYLQAGYDVFTNYLVVENNRKIGIYNTQGNLVLPVQYDSIVSQNCLESSCFFVLKNDLKYYAVKFSSWNGFDKKIVVSRAYDEIISTIGILQTDQKRTYFELDSEKEIQPVNDLLTFKGQKFNLVLNTKTNLFGATDLEGKTLIPTIYTNAKFLTDRPDVMTGFENGVLYYIYPTTNERYTENEW